jgi:DnaJ-class molecular chaperone
MPRARGTEKEDEQMEKMKRCEPCCGMGYKGRQRPSGWKIETCRACGGGGQVEATRRQPSRRVRRAVQS